MKAVILAGGFGTRLMPMTACCPKPMIKIMDKPIIEYGLEQLKKYGITDICITLGYLPEIVESYIKANESFGMNINCVTECTPCGTAGSVRKCANSIGEDDFIVISGDAICDFDLGKCIEKHRELNSKASILLYAHPDPLEFGLVVTDGTGRVEGFVEKPSWDRVETNLINTGIYIFSHEVLDRIPADKNVDFGKDVFPDLLKSDFPLYGIEAEGYWCDVGSPTAYRKCVGDMLEGKTSLSLPRSADMGEGVKVIPPAYISIGAHIADGAVIGSHTVIGDGSVIGKDAHVSGSVIDGGKVMEGCEIEGAVMCRGSLAMPNVKIGEGCIIADETEIGGGGVLMPNVSVWPRQKIEAGQLVAHSIVTGSLRGFPEFTGSGVMAGKYNSELTPETCFQLGAACPQLGKVGVAWEDTPAAAALASSFVSGALSSGGDVYTMDVRFPSAAAFMGGAVGAAVTAFISESGGDAVVSFFDGHGLPISRSAERKLESVFASGRRYAPSEDTGTLHRVTGGETIYTAAAVKQAAVKDMGKSVKICVIADSTADSVLKTALTDMGCELTDGQNGTAVFEIEHGGGALNARDENGGFVNWEQIICIIARDELESGGKVAVPFTAPRAFDRLSDNQDWRILRVGRDEDAEKVYHSSPWQWDGVFAAVKLAAIMGKTGKTLAELTESVPDFAVTSREVKLSGTRGEAMRRLGSMTEFGRDDGPGLWFGGESGFARVRPASDGEALSITAECATMEAAEELCGKVRDMIEIKANT